MEPMTLDEAKAAAMRIETYRSELSRTYAEGIAVVLADALRDAEAQVAALTAKLATARADAIEEAANVVRAAVDECDEASVEYRAKGDVEHGRSRDVAAYHLRKAEKAIRALATKPPDTSVQISTQTALEHGLESSSTTR
jgi:uncharacterized coiled-coil DUF342 family protein